MAATRQCPDCGKQYTTKARFCRSDGARLVDVESKPGDVTEPDVGESSGRTALPGVALPSQRTGDGALPSTASGGGGLPGTSVGRPLPRKPGDDAAAKRRDPRRESRRDAAKADPMLGRVIAGRFLLESVLGSGATGVVYRATHRALGRQMAVKLLKQQFIWDERSLQRFLREAKTCSLLDHPNIVYLYDFGRGERAEPYLVMEFAEGETLHSAIRSSATMTMPVERALGIMLQVARALEHAHGRGVIHRDIKPENIVITKSEGGDDRVKILDFGVARIVGQAPVTGHGQVTGTAEFIAPETLIGDGTVTPSVDLYAMGIIFHEAIVGRPPFTGALEVVLHQHMHTVPPMLSERSADPEISEELDLLVARLLEKEPVMRPSAGQLVRELESLQLQGWLESVEPAAPVVEMSDADTGRIGLHQRPTTVVQAWDRKTEMSDRLGRPTQIVGRQSWPTRLVPSMASDRQTRVMGNRVPTAEENLEVAERQSSLLYRAAVTLAAQLWPGGWPQALLNLLQHNDGCDQQEKQLVASIAELDQQSRQQTALHKRHHALRQEILLVSERLRTGEDLDDIERGRLLSELESLERAFFSSDDRWGTLARPTSEPLRQRLLDLRATRRRSRILFARLLVAMPCPPSFAAEREQVVAMLATAESLIK
jgi:serine/threonine protein kinase